ncbi:LysR family transcriptional regulator [Ensifer adhaerens]|uniref:LysR family transcriptional regulator n=1 Tax=Ensifer adhaerens TaxID=106592 RepID=UPI001CC1761D|nr:LysR family transcriptional regulator [Ensifer adhaerens]UAX95957.1 LysR family transcriptional regulator [Ensifer adhaerens]
MKDPASALPWEDLRIIKAIGDHGGLSSAATALSLNHSTVARRLAIVEEILGVALFDRLRTGCKPTTAGTEILALSARVEQDIINVARRVAGSAERLAGELRIATSDALLYDFLTPIIVDFQRIHPDIRVEVLVGNAPLNLARGESDIAFRATLAPPENLYGRKIAKVAWAIYGRRDDFLGRQPRLEDLYEQQWISYGSGLKGLRAFSFVEERVAAQNIIYRADSVLGVASALCAGGGIGFLPCMHGDLVPSLVRVSAVQAQVYDELWILTHPDIRKSGRVYAFMTHCAQAVIKRRDFIEGVGTPGVYNPAAKRDYG